MNKWRLKTNEIKLVKAVCRLQPTDENQLAQALGWTPQNISNMIASLIQPGFGCPSGVLTATMQGSGGSTVEHALNVKVTPLGRQICDSDGNCVQC